MNPLSKFTNLPSQFELTSIASALPSGDASQRMQVALDLWDAAGNALWHRQRIAKQIDSASQNLDDQLAPIAGIAPITAAAIQKAAMPNSKPEDRARKFRSFMRETLAVSEGVAGDELETLVMDSLERMRLAPLAPDYGEALFVGFSRFVEADRQKTFADRAKKGAAAKKSLGTTPVPLKTPQAPAKPPQAKRKPRQA